MNRPTRFLTAALVIICSGLLSAPTSVGAAEPAVPANAIVLTTKRMCCAKESVPAIKELNKIPGIASVKANHKTRSLTIVPRAGAYTSPRAIWEAAERVKLDPIRLATATEVHESKPKR